MSSTPSTPRSTRAASPGPGPGPGSDTEMLLTPGRKIKAMLAAFDSDSEDDDNNHPTQDQKSKGLVDRSTTKLSDALKKSTISSFVAADSAPMDEDEDGDEDEEEIVRPKGRMAARLQGTSPSGATSAFERVARRLRDEETKGHGLKDEEEEAGEEEDEDYDHDLPTAGPRRRGVTSLLPEPEVDEDDDEEPRTRAYSPLFVSSPVEGRDHEEDHDANGTDDEDDAQLPKKNARFLALVAQKRKEREEKERAEAERRAAARAARQQGQSDSEMALSASEGDGDGDGASSGAEAKSNARKQQEQTRPAARKASRKALEEMNRETQRMSRNMQLAHQAQTKKKITKESFFARFNFGQPAVPPPGETSSSAAGSQNSSDVEAQKDKETPRTSPVLGPADKASAAEDTSNENAAEPEFPTLEEILANPPTQPEEPVVARMEVESTAAPPLKKEKKALNLPAVRVRLSREEVARHQQDDSDSDLEIVTSPAKCRRIAAFENLPAKKLQESASMIKLKALAHLTSPNRKSKGMNGAQLSATLLLKARQQAARERQERIAELRAKGIHIETAEERAAMEDELENLVEKARLEADAIAKQERKAAKRDGDDDDEDEDFEYSGSEDGENGEDDEDEEMADAPVGGNGLVDSEADEGDESDDDKSEVMSSEEMDIPTQRRKRQTRVISDDEDEDEVQEPKTPAKPITGATTPGTRSVDRPHLPAQSSNDLLSLTQAFAGTIAGSPQRSQQTPAPTLPSTLPEPGLHESDSNVIIKDSQVPRAESHDILTHYAPSTARVSESPAPRSVSNFSQIPDPTQDEGFILSPFDPSKRFLGTPQSTIDTVIVDQNQSPVPTRSMRHLKRGGRAADLFMIEEQEEDNGDFEINANAFNIMKASKKNKQPAVLFDKSKSKARDVVEEAAEESDDEYAGLGGGSDEDDDDEENAYDRAMINDHSGETVDEKQLAALNAHHQRTTDEKQVAKLLKDITTGALRRRRGANADDEFDLDDSDDELLARRREKQREFARMRKALLADEKMGEIAENPKKAAFFRAVEDRDDDDEDMGLEFVEEGEDAEGSQQDNNLPQPEPAESQPDTTNPENSNKRKRPLNPSTESTYNRPPPHLRRKPASAMSKKPATLAEIRETLSFLTETHEYDSFHEDASLHDADDPDHEEPTLDPADFASDDNSDTSDDELAAVVGPPHPQKRPPSNLLTHHPRRTRGPVVDRLALLRQASSNSASTTTTTGNKFAFATDTPTTDRDRDTFGFTRPPPFLRRSTTASTSSASSSSSSSSSGPSSRRTSATSSVPSRHGANPPGQGLKKPGGGATASVNSYTAARERERAKELRMQSAQRGGGGSKRLTAALLDPRAADRLGALGGGRGQWE